MKKILALALALVLMFALVACNSGGSSTPASSGGDAPASSGSTGGGGADPGDAPTPDNPLTIRLGHVGGPTSSLQEAAVTIAEEVAEKTDGAVNIEVYPQAQLGDATIMLDGLTTGTVEACMVGCNEIATMIPDFYMFVLPFLFTDMDEFLAVANTDAVVDKCNEITEAKGITLIGFSSGEERGFSNTKRAVHTPADMEGLSIRIMAGSVYVDTFAALGVATSTMAFGEVYTALQQGVIDGEDNGMGMYVDMKFVEVEKNHTVLNHMMQCNPMLISTSIWNKLSAEQQQIIQDAEANWAAAYPEYYKSYLAEKTAGAEAENSEIVYLTEDERQAFADATKDVYDKYADMVDDGLYDLVTGEVENYRK